MNEKIDCIWINVDCVHNDSVSIKEGGTTYLGFDFCVKENEKELFLEYIKEVLNEFNVPIIKIGYGKATKRSNLKIWNKHDIYEAIKDDSYYLIEKTKRNYKKNTKIK